ncbi:MAG: MipA/OmpV family protein [Pseudomonadota bacterium]
MLVRFLAVGFGAIALSMTAAPSAHAQGNEIDEPFLDPLIGKKREREQAPEVVNDDEFDAPRPWNPVRGFVGVLTFLTPDTTDLSVGVGPVFQPDYFGSDDYEIEADPQVYVKFNNFVFLDDDGADFGLFGFSGFTFGPSIRIVGDRDEDENPALQGLGDIGLTFELGGFVSTTFADRMNFRFKVRQGIATGHRGLIVDATSTALLYRSRRFSLSVTGQTAWIGNDYADTFFSVTPEQSISSGLPVFDAGRGFRDFGGSVNAYVNIGKRWSMNPYASYRRIVGDTADTPIVADLGDRNQFVVGFHIMREFEFNMF